MMLMVICLMHRVQGKLEGAYNSRPSVLRHGWPNDAKAISRWTYAEARDAALFGHAMAFPHCNREAVKAQLDAYHHGIGIMDHTSVRSYPGAETRSAGRLNDAQAKRLDDEVSRIRYLDKGSENAF
jgi:hypothetical protein